MYIQNVLGAKQLFVTAGEGEAHTTLRLGSVLPLPTVSGQPACGDFRDPTQ